MRANDQRKNEAIELIQTIRGLLSEPSLATRHRKRDEDFTRECSLTFPVLMLLLLKKSLKSLQSRLHEFFSELSQGVGDKMVSRSAVSRARAKLNGSVFVELNTQGVLKSFYRDRKESQVKTWHNHRLLGIDSSLVRLPESQEIRETFSVVKVRNQHARGKDYPEGRVSVLYDLLNQLGLDGRLEGSRRSENDQAFEHLEHVRPWDLLLTDRGYAAYLWFMAVKERGANFVSRCSRNTFGIVKELFQRDQAGISIVTTLRSQKNLWPELRAKGWSLEMEIRFVTVRLDTGKLEVLATSLLDEVEYPTEEFAELYDKRWGHETYYGRLKGAFDLEHFSGKTVASIEQDFQATVFLANLENILIGPAEAKMAEKSPTLKHPVQVNRKNALHAIKYRAIDLLASQKPAEEILEELTRWFLDNPVTVRRKRKVPRHKPSSHRSYNYQRRLRKIVF